MRLLLNAVRVEGAQVWDASVDEEEKGVGIFFSR